MKTQRGICLAIALLAAGSSAGANAEPVPVVGLDKNHQPRSASLPEAELSKLFGTLLDKVNGSTVAALEAREKTSAPSKSAYWLLRDVCVGLGVTLTAGLGPIWSVSAAPRVRLGFSNSTHPKIPD